MAVLFGGVYLSYSFYSVAQADLELSDPPASASQTLAITDQCCEAQPFLSI